MEEFDYLVYVKLAIAFLLSYGILKLTIKTAPGVYSLRFISGYYTFQFAAILLYLIVLPDGKVNNDELPNLLFKDYVEVTILGYLLFQTGILVSALIGRLPFGILQDKQPFVQFVQINSKYLAGISLLGGLITLAYPLLSFLPGVGYLVAILFNFTRFLPFVSGLLFFKQKKNSIIWLIALSVLFVIGILTGGRGTAMISGVIFSLGFYYALTTFRAKTIAIASATIIAIPLIGFLALVGIFRQVVGRVDYSKIDIARAIRVYEQYEKLKNSKKLDLNSSEAKNQGWGRLVNFVNVYQFATIPSQRPHLGFEDMFSTDFRYAYDLSFISGTTREDRVRNKSGNFRLVDYGYNVNMEYSVEYSIVTDSFIRFGFLGLFIFAFAISFFCQFLEFVINLTSKGNSAFYVLATVMLCQQALFGYAYNIFVITRSMIIAVVTAAVLAWTIKIIKAFFSMPKKPEHHTSGLPESTFSK